MIQETVCRAEKTRSFPVMTMYTGVLEGMEKWCGIENFEDSKGVTHSVAATRTLFWTLPKVLILSLTVKTVVTLEEDLDLTKWLHPESTECKTHYKLFATCIHSGSQNGGHYSAFTKHRDQWYFKDDDAVSKVDSYPKTCGHHIMFFK
jgi:ubiquitin C-terminal hydrolase